jgi:thiol-disulfide isomerase/thioredoxin
MMAQMMGKAEVLKRYYNILVNEYGDTQFGQIAKARLKPELTIAVGKPVPDFSVTALEDSKKVYSKSSLKGKYYLLDFWAVWCGPCIAEMDNLHEAYEKFKKKNFEILSLSFDPKPEDVIKFRNEKWKMPWLHSFVQGGFNSDLAKSFEVIGIPKPILVDRDGNIVATDMDLRGEHLEKTLAKHLGE